LGEMMAGLMMEHKNPAAQFKLERFRK